VGFGGDVYLSCQAGPRQGAEPLVERHANGIEKSWAARHLLDLPGAVEHAAPILAHEGMGDRVVMQAGNALTTISVSPSTT
jgi:hypothetical protein